MFERAAFNWLVSEFSQVCIKLRNFSGLCPTFQPLSKIESSKGAVPMGQTHPRMTSSFGGSTEVGVGGAKKGLIGFKLQNPVECSYSGAYWFQNRCATQLERGSAGCRLTNFALNTNTDCFRRRLCCHSTCPRGIRCYISALLFSLPATSASCPHAPPHPPSLIPPLPLAGIRHGFVFVSTSRQTQT